MVVLLRCTLFFNSASLMADDVAALQRELAEERAARAVAETRLLAALAQLRLGGAADAEAVGGTADAASVPSRPTVPHRSLVSPSRGTSGVIDGVFCAVVERPVAAAAVRAG